MDVIITGNQINFNLFNCVLKNEIKMSEPLIFTVIHQPHVFFSLSNTSDSCQVQFCLYLYFVLIFLTLIYVKIFLDYIF